jgi:hypothetical protein
MTRVAIRTSLLPVKLVRFIRSVFRICPCVACGFLRRDELPEFPLGPLAFWLN